MGHKQTLKLTAIGDTVNIASRMESHTKEHRCEMVISDMVAQTSGYDFSHCPYHEFHVRGREAPIPVRVVSEVQSIQMQ